MFLPHGTYTTRRPQRLYFKKNKKKKKYVFTHEGMYKTRLPDSIYNTHLSYGMYNTHLDHGVYNTDMYNTP